MGKPSCDCPKTIEWCSVMDMRWANEAIERKRFPIPTVDELLQGTNCSKVFSKLDFKLCYHQVEVTPELHHSTTFAVQNGLHRYKRLLSAVSSAREQYQHEITNILAGIEGVKMISDDVIIHACNQETQNK